MRIYFRAKTTQSPSGYKRVVLVAGGDLNQLDESDISELGEQLDCDIAFPLPYDRGLLVMSRRTNYPCEKEIAQHFGERVSYVFFQGGIFNPYLPVRVYDYWPDI